ncbi:MAG: histidine kinase [Acidobacteriota bacterium]
MADLSIKIARRRLPQWAIIICGWTLFGLFFASQGFISQARYDGRIAWARTLAVWLMCAYSWAALTPAILWLARRFPLERRKWLRSLAIHLASAAFFSVFALVIFIFLREIILPDTRPPLVESLWSLATAEFHAGLLIYSAVVGIDHALDYYRRYRDRELRASQLETRLVQAQLDALKMQLHPHFLFNTLNSISVLMRRDVDAADRMLVGLSNLLRVTLASKTAHEIPLREELDFLEKYLEIEQTRFRDRLTVRMRIETEAIEAMVPHLIFQPLVENAIRHGIRDRETGGLIEIRAERRGDKLRLEVRDDGPGIEESFSEGVGLSNTRARLEYLYGAEGRLELRNDGEGGLVTSVQIPFR